MYVAVEFILRTTEAVALEYTLKKENAYRGLPENARMILAMQSDHCASHPFRSFLFATDNMELVSNLAFWQDVEKTRQDYQFGTMSFDNFVESVGIFKRTSFGNM